MNNVATKDLNKLAQEAERAAKVATRNRFLIEMYLSLSEAKAGKLRSYRSAKHLFKKLGI